MSVAKNEALLQLIAERKAVDEIIILIDIFPHKSIKQAGKTLKYAFMWLGQAKGALGAENPYPVSTDPTSPRIEPPTDKATSVKVPHETLDPKDEVAVIKYLRGRIGEVIKAILNDTQIFPQEQLYQISVKNAWMYACNAKMELGLALDAYRTKHPTTEAEATAAPAAETTADTTAPPAPVVDPPAPVKTKENEPPSGEDLMKIQKDALVGAEAQKETKKKLRQQERAAEKAKEEAAAGETTAPPSTETTAPASETTAPPAPVTAETTSSQTPAPTTNESGTKGGANPSNTKKSARAGSGKNTASNKAAGK